MIAGDPFVGLRPFDRGDAHLFFGRDAQLDVLTSRLATQRFVAVLGSSGSGKSSLVRAGLLPALEGGLVPGAGSAWAIAIMTPGANPIGNLAAALTGAGVAGSRSNATADPSAFVETILRRGALGLVEAVHESALGSRPLFVLVDQFEEIFRFKRVAEAAGGHDHAAAFVKLLLEAVRQPSPAVYVMLTMRSEFLGNASEFRDLPEAINDGLFLIPRLTRDQLTQAVTGPVAVAGGHIAPSLVQRLLNDVGDDADQLPVLQHALMRTWERWRSTGADPSGLTIEHYEAVKGLGGALSEHADEAFLELSDLQKKTAAIIFAALTERGPDGREVRRPTTAREIADVAGVRIEAIVPIVDRFRQEGRSFLMPSGTVAITPDTVIDVSHESLMRKWKRLRDWVVAEAEDRRIFLRLSDSAAQHAAGQEPLLHDPRLTFSAQWRARFLPTEAWARRYAPNFAQTLAYLDTSLSTRHRQVLRRQLIRGVAALALVAMTAGSAWWYHWNEDQKERVELDKKTEELTRREREVSQQEQLATTQENLADLKTQLAEHETKRADEATRQLDQLKVNQREAQRLVINSVRQAAQLDPSRSEEAALVALHALENAHLGDDEGAVVNTKAALTEAVRLLPEVRLHESLPDGLRAIGASRDIVSAFAAGNPNPRVWRFGAGGTAVPLKAKVPAGGSLSWASNGRRNVSVSRQAMHIWDADTGATREFAFGAAIANPRMVLSADGEHLLLSKTGGVELWNLTSGGSVALESAAAGQMAFAGDGRTCATGMPGAIHLWTVDGTRLGADVPLKWTAQRLILSQNGRWMAAASGSQVDFWRIADDRKGGVPVESLNPAMPSLGAVTDLAVSTREEFLAVSYDSGTVTMFELPTAPSTILRPVNTSSIRHARGEILRLRFSPDDQYLATGGQDKTARLWRNAASLQARPAGLPRWTEVFRVSHLESVSALAFLADGTLVSADARGLVRASAIPRAEDLAKANDLMRVSCARLGRTLNASEWMSYFRLESYRPLCKYSLDPVQVLEVEIAQAQSGNAKQARQAAETLATLKTLSDLSLDRLLTAATVEARVKNDDLAEARISMAMRIAAAITDQQERADAENEMCWMGAMNGFASQVLKACDDAVRLNKANLDFMTTSAIAYARSGDRGAARARFLEAVQMAGALTARDARGRENNNVCWRGAIFNFAQEVRPACDAAVAVDRNIAYLDSQGVAYALIGTPELLKIAAANFRAYAKATGARADTLTRKRLQWAEAIDKGRNPFKMETRAVLEGLERDLENEFRLVPEAFSKG